MENAWIELFSDPLDVDAADTWLRDEACGALNLFVGTTRRFTAGRETIQLEYEAYEPMALKEMERIARRCANQWEIVRLVMLHRLGVVPLAEASVVVGVATPHREDAFPASRFLIDTLKKQVPIWKKEVYADGTTEWVEGKQKPTLLENSKSEGS